MPCKRRSKFSGSSVFPVIGFKYPSFLYLFPLEGGRLGWGLSVKRQRPPDNRLHLFKVIQYLVIPESHHSKPTCHKPFCPQPIILDPLAMLSSIHLDDQSGLEANEIEYVAPEWMLTMKLVASLLALTEMLPKAFFRIGHLMA